MGAAASKNASEEPPPLPYVLGESRGAEGARRDDGGCKGMLVTSSRTTSIRGSEAMRASTAAENRFPVDREAPPAGHGCLPRAGEKRRAHALQLDLEKPRRGVYARRLERV